MEESPIGKRVVAMLAKEANIKKHNMVQLHRENNVYNFYLKKGRHGSVAPLEEGHSAKSKSELIELIGEKTKEELVELLQKADRKEKADPRWPL